MALIPQFRSCHFGWKSAWEEGGEMGVSATVILKAEAHTVLQAVCFLSWKDGGPYPWNLPPLPKALSLRTFGMCLAQNIIESSAPGSHNKIFSNSQTDLERGGKRVPQALSHVLRKSCL